jgi:hypothetical protein
MADKLDGAAIVANSLPATAIVAGSITTTQLAPSVANVVTVGSNPKIASLDYPGDDTAANTGGGQTVVINGSGFKSNVSVYINGNAVPSVTYTNANSISITTPALAAATYPLYVINTDDGGTAILIPGIQYSGTPSWVTTSPLDGQQALSAWSISLSATSDSSVTYALQAGSSLPTGISLAANGLISGTMSSPPESDTTYNFTVVATDAELQDASKAFSVAVTVAVDTQFQYTTLLLQADGTNNGNNHAFLDSSNNNFTITRNGNATQGSFTPFSPTGWSNFFNGPNTGSYLRTPVSTDFQLGTSDFTIEFWAFTTSGASDTTVCQTDSGGSGYFGMLLNYHDATNVTWYATSNGSSWNVINGGVLCTVASIRNTWTHFAYVRNGNTFTAYVNGIAVYTTTSSASIYQSANQFVFGSSYAGSHPSNFGGYLSNFRYVKGTAVYTSNFTPSTTPLTAITNTKLLSCQSNRFIDASASAHTLTIGGTPSIQPFSPFNPTAAWSAATYGGSGYFDGSGDYLETTSSQIIPSGNFTIEAWAYITSNSSTQTIVAQGTGVGDGARTWMGIENSSGAKWAVQVGGTQAISSVTPVLNAWHHLAMVYNGSTIKMYLNGTEIASASSTTNASNTTLKIGTNWGGYITTGFLSNIRISNTARTISAVPSSLLAADANTVFLANFTNAQIYDAAAGAVLECVGDAKVNTAIKKFGAGSIAFDGTGDYLKFPVSADLFNPYRGEYTVEMWVYPVSLASGGTGSSRYGTLICQQALGSSIQWGFGFNSSGNLVYTYWNGSSTVQITSNGPAIAANTWSHVGFTYTSSGIRLFTNGLLTSATAMTGTPSTSTTESIFIGIEGRTGGGELYYNGYIDDLRISKGLARYRYNFTPPTRAFATKGGTQTLTADEDFEYTTLLLPGNGTNNQNNHTFLDSSNNNFTITRNGNATQGTFSPFSQTGWSNYFDGSGDNLTAASNAAFSPGTGDFTYESWIYPLNWSGTTSTIFVVTNTGGLWIGKNSSNFVVRAYGVADQLQTTLFPAVNQWTHVAVARSGTTLSLYYNGTRIATTTNSYNFAQAGLCIGDDGGASAPFAGYISNSRLVKGTAVYDPTQTTITVPTAKLTTITNTSILTCSTNRFVDESTNNFTLTRNGDTSVQAFSPFAPTASYAAANVGGSGYFDGTGDYLTATSPNLSGTWTVEFWWYPTAGVTSQQTLVSFNNGVNSGINIWCNGSSLLVVDDGVNGQSAFSSASFVANQWNHVAIVRSGSTTTGYINGVAAGSNSFTPGTTSAISIGRYNGGSFYYVNGYISGLRLVNGTAVYTSAFTPPTSPPSNVANTAVLCNFTNAGITDATAKNVLETVGDAKISTTQSKFGGSSMYFDGTGDYCLSPVSQNFAFGTGDFTVECWIRTNTATQSLFGTLQGTGSYGLVFSVSALYWQNSTMVSNLMNATATPILDNNWHHVAVSRFNGTSRMFFDGIQVTSASDTTNYTATTGMSIGYNNSSAGPFNGYINDLRITKGIARYTQNFALPTTAFLTK